MRIKLDENIPYRLVHVLGPLGHDVDTVRDEDQTGQSDPASGKRRSRRGDF